MWVETNAAAMALAFSVLALACGAAAWARAAKAATPEHVGKLLDLVRSESLLWKSAAQALQSQVEDAIDRLERKRRTLAGTESRLAARENQDEVDAAMAEQADQPDPSNLTRADLRALRRGGEAA